MPLSDWPRPSRPSWRSPDGGRIGPAPLKRSDHGRSAAEDGGHAFSCLARNAGDPGSSPRLCGGVVPAGEENEEPPLRTRSACRPIALSKAVVRPFGEGSFRRDPTASTKRMSGRVTAFRYWSTT
jgi:hypothetical protein